MADKVGAGCQTDSGRQKPPEGKNGSSEFPQTEIDTHAVKELFCTSMRIEAINPTLDSVPYSFKRSKPGLLPAEFVIRRTSAVGITALRQSQKRSRRLLTVLQTHPKGPEERNIPMIPSGRITA